MVREPNIVMSQTDKEMLVEIQRKFSVAKRISESRVIDEASEYFLQRPTELLDFSSEFYLVPEPNPDNKPHITVLNIAKSKIQYLNEPQSKSLYIILCNVVRSCDAYRKGLSTC